ncbi:MAG TPA: ThiF family adenylyltransferase [Candidatus Didemnitutus sp.]|jgi:adenylyltransferase/sulfurtransferase
MFALSDQPIDAAAWRAKLASPDAGASVVFEGRVRNHHGGRAVLRLEYEAFGELAVREGEDIVTETEKLYPGSRVHCVHRTGRLEVGEIAVWIGVEAPHRQTAYAASRHVIEELKRSLPVWKKEHFEGADPEWVNCPAEQADSPAVADEFHARQVALPEIGVAGQEKLAISRVLVVGIGGLGCPAALYLTGAGIGHLTLVDDGHVERSNLARQILFTEAETGAPKVLAAAARLRRRNPAVQITPLDVAFGAGNARTLVAGQDVVIDGTDNFAARFLIHDACMALGVPLVQAAVHRFEGTLDVFRRGEGGCLHCHWSGHGAVDLEATASCEAGAVFAPAVGVLGVMQAAEAIKQIVGRGGEAAHQTRLIDLLDGTSQIIERPARPGCPACSRTEAAPLMIGADDSPYFAGSAIAPAGVSPLAIRLIQEGELLAPANDMIDVPAHDLARLRELAAAGPIMLRCRNGVRSSALARLLRAEGLDNVYAWESVV